MYCTSLVRRSTVALVKDKARSRRRRLHDCTTFAPIRLFPDICPPGHLPPKITKADIRHPVDDHTPNLTLNSSCHLTLIILTVNFNPNRNSNRKS